MDIIDLGGNIELKGFSSIDDIRMIVIKKIIGTYARKFRELGDQENKLIVTLNQHDEDYTVFLEYGKLQSDSTRKNIFNALGGNLTLIEKQLD